MTVNFSYWTVLSALAPVLLTVCAGGGARRVGWLSEEADRSLLRLTVNLLTPCLIFDKVLGNAALHTAGNVVLAPLTGFAMVIAGLWIGRWVASLLGGLDDGEKRTFALATGLYNYGYLPLPLALALFDERTVGVLFTHNLGVEAALWTAGLVMLTGDSRTANQKSGGAWRHILNPPVCAIMAAVALNSLGADSWLPGWFLQTVHLLGGAAIPLGLVLTGATFVDLFREGELRGGGRVMSVAVVLRMMLTPWLFLALARWLPCPPELRCVLVMQAAMPAAVIPIVLTKHYGGSPRVAVQVLVATSAVGLLTIPLWLRFGLHFAGL